MLMIRNVTTAVSYPEDSAPSVVNLSFAPNLACSNFRSRFAEITLFRQTCHGATLSSPEAQRSQDDRPDNRGEHDQKSSRRLQSAIGKRQEPGRPLQIQSRRAKTICAKWNISSTKARSTTVLSELEVQSVKNGRSPNSADCTGAGPRCRTLALFEGADLDDAPPCRNDDTAPSGAPINKDAAQQFRQAASLSESLLRYVGDFAFRIGTSSPPSPTAFRPSRCCRHTRPTATRSCPHARSRSDETNRPLPTSIVLDCTRSPQTADSA